MSMIPPPPAGLTLPTLLDTPIIGESMLTALSQVSSGSVGQDLIWTLAGRVLQDFVLKPVILVAGSLAGVELGRVAERRLRPRSDEWRKRVRGRSAPASLMAFLLVLVILLPGALVPVSSLNLPEDIYAEAAVTQISEKGQVVFGSVFLESGVGATPLPSGLGERLLGAMVVSHMGDDMLIRALGKAPEGVETLIGAMPQTFGVILYVDTPAGEADAYSNQLAAALSLKYGAPLRKLVTVEVPLGGEGQNPVNVTATLLYSDAKTADVAARFMADFTDRGGLTRVASAVFIPQATGTSSHPAAGMVVAAGFLNVNSILKLYPIEEEMESIFQQVSQAFKGFTSFSGGVALWSRGATTPDGRFDALATIGVAPPVTQSSEAAISVFSVIGPAPRQGEVGTMKTRVASSLGFTPEERSSVSVMLQSLGVALEPGAPSAITSEDATLPASGVSLPADLEVSKTITPRQASPGGTVSVTVTVRNRDTRRVEGVTISDGEALIPYAFSATKVEGDDQAYMPALQPGETTSLIYRIRVTEPGQYAFKPAEITYSVDRVEHSDYSAGVTLVSDRPSPLVMPFSLASMTLGDVAQLADMAIHGSGSTLTTGILVVFLALVVFEAVRSYRRWIREPVSEPVNGGG